MRRSLLVWALALAVSLCLCFAAALPATGPIDAVTADMEVLAGDPSAARGLTLYNIYYHDYLFWKTRIDAETGELLTSFRFATNQGNLNTQDDIVWQTASLSGGEEQWRWDEEHYARETELAWYDLYFTERGFDHDVQAEIAHEYLRQVPEGESAVFKVRLADYVEKYAYQIYTSPAYNYGSHVPTRTVDGLIDRSVDENYILTLSVERFADGSVSYGYGYGAHAEDNSLGGGATGEGSHGSSAGAVDDMAVPVTDTPLIVGPEAISAITLGVEGGSFIALEMHEDVQSMAEDSWFPKGFGVFYVPWAYERFADMPENTAGLQTAFVNGQTVDGVPMPQTEQLRLVLPLDRNSAKILSMDVSPDSRYMSLLTEEADGRYLTVFDAKSGDMLQRERLPDALQAESEGLDVRAENDFLVVVTAEGPFAVWTVDAGSHAALAFTGDAGEASWWGPYRIRRDVFLAWRDGKLAVADCTPTQEVEIYNAGGLLFHAAYPLNLDTADSYSGAPHPYSTAPQLTWTP